MLHSVIKRPIETVLQKFDKAVVHRARELTSQKHAQLRISLPMLLSELYLADPGVNLVQVGALEGLDDDPLKEFLSRHPINSILIEPQPLAFSRLRSTYSGSRNITVCNSAIDVADGRRALYTVSGGPGVPSWAEGLASFDKSTILKHAPLIPDLAQHIQPIEVDCVTPSTLMQRYGIDEIHALVVDTEGYDLEILRSFWAAGVRPKVLCVEHKHLSRRDFRMMMEMLIESGYSIVQLHADLLARRTGPSHSRLK